MTEQLTQLPWKRFGAAAQAAQRGLPGPVVVGGVGGSGTRVIASMMKLMGFYMGAHLNRAEDNVWFYILMGRHSWLKSANIQDMTRMLTIFDQAMHDDLSPIKPGNIAYVLNSLREFGPINPDPEKHVRSFRANLGNKLRAAASMLRLTRRVDFSQYRAWGWKVPQSQIILSALADYYPSMKYILVARNGLDMAFSKNQQQVANWSWVYDLIAPDHPIPPAESLTYWVTATEATIAVGKEKLGDRFMMLHFDNLCLSPEQEVDKLIEFIGMDVPAETRAEMVRIPSPPSSIGRYRQHDLSQFKKADIEAVKRLGFQVDL